MSHLILIVTMFVLFADLPANLTTADAQIFRYRPGAAPQYRPGAVPQYRPRTYGQPVDPYTGRPYVQPRSFNGGSIPTSAVPGSNVVKGSAAAPVTPEEAMKLYNRPKTNPPPKIEPGSIYPRIGAEFEPQNAIVISLSELLPQHGSVFTRIATLTSGHVKLVVLFNEPAQVKMAMEILTEADANFDHLHFMQLKMDTVWLRDFGPIMAEEKKGSMTIDFFYDGQRPVDDSFPARWAELIESTHNSVPWTIQGGNLMCNGQGLALTTSRLFDDNKITFPGSNTETEKREFIVKEFKQYTNLKHIEVLEPLRNEATKHVDMFAAFVGVNKVLVAQLDDPSHDPINARVLDYNAKKLSQLKVDGKPLEVHRIKVPPRIGESWSPYTNVIIANKLVMIPVMKTDDVRIIRAAVDVYRKLMPDHRVATVDISTMSKLQGALHCMSINVPQFAPLPNKLVSFARVKTWMEKLEEVDRENAKAKVKANAKSEVIGNR